MAPGTPHGKLFVTADDPGRRSGIGVTVLLDRSLAFPTMKADTPRTRERSASAQRTL
jgi:hypothetical protein